MLLKRPHNNKMSDRPISGRAPLTFGLVLCGACISETIEITSRSRVDWSAFSVVALLGVALALAPVVAVQRQAFVSFVVAISAGMALLPPALVLPLVAAFCVVDFFRRPVALSSLIFNIATFGAAGVIGSELLRDLDVLAPGAAASPLTLAALIGVASSFALSCGVAFEIYAAPQPAAGRIAVASAIDGSLAVMGLLAAQLWLNDLYWLIPLALLPLAFIHRAQRLPRLQQEATLDPKTELLNMRAFAIVFELSLKQAARVRQPVSLLVIDLDDLRGINSQHGHIAGDGVIVGVSEIIRRVVRASDTAARFGGDEYLVLLPDATALQAAEIGERIRSQVASTLFSKPGSSAAVRATVSIGTVTSTDHNVSMDELVRAADVAVYEAKSRGRNRLIVESGSNGAGQLDLPAERPVTRVDSQ
jgi:diguanylate cyclase (GGDEF)-like protein